MSDQVDELYTRIKELEEEARRLRAELVSDKVDVPASWGLSPRQEIAYRLLASRDCVTYDLFKFALYPNVAEELEDVDCAVRNVLMHLRRKLRPHGIGINPIFHAGWSLRRGTVV